MPRILSISYDKALLHTRELLLSREGFEVKSVVGISAAIQACEKASFNLIIIGHSIPRQDKEAIVKQLRAMSPAPILSLRRPNESDLKSVEYSFDPGDPSGFLAYVKQIANSEKQSPA